MSNAEYVKRLEDAVIEAAGVLEKFGPIPHTHDPKGCAGCDAIFAEEFQRQRVAVIEHARQIEELRK